MNKFLAAFISSLIGLGLVLGNSMSIRAEEEFALEEITVTATKTEENQQKVGIAMEVLTGQNLKNEGDNDIEDILSQVSGVLVSRTIEGLRITVHGIGLDFPAGFGDNAQPAPGTVSVNLNGIFTPKNPTSTALYDIERVEVLFGPQSTIYASNAPGGIVNVEMKKPKLDVYEATGTVEFGNYSLLHTEGALNIPVGDIIALRTAFNTQVHDGYISNGGDDEDSKAARVRFLLQPNDKFTALISGDIERHTGRGSTEVPAFIDQDDVDDPWHSDVELIGLPRDIKQHTYYGDIEYDFGFGVMVILPNIQDRDWFRTETATDLSGALLDSEYNGSHKEDAIEIRIDSPSGSKIVWNLGYFWYDGKSRSDQTSTDRNTGAFRHIAYQQKIKMKAFFGNITFPLTDEFRLIAGARYSDDHLVAGRHYIDPADDPYLTDMSYNDPDYKIGLEYDITDDAMFYANVSTSYLLKSESMDYAGNTYPPSTITAYTAGVKSRFLDNRLQINSDVFYYDYKNRVHVAMELHPIQTPFGPIMIPDEGGRAPGDSRMYGADIRTSAIISSQDRLDVSISYLDAWVKHLFFDYEFLPDKDYSNRTPTFSPKWTINLNYAHNFYLPNGGTLTAKLESKYQSDYLIEWKDFSMGFDYTGYKTQKAHHIDDISLIYSNPDGKWTITGYVKNLSNYAEKRFMNLGSNMNLGPPRTYGAVLSVSY